MESYISIFNTLFATNFSIKPKAYPEVVRIPHPCFVVVLIAPILIVLVQFCSSDYLWASVTFVIFVIVTLISYFHQGENLKAVGETYTTAWEEKTRNIAKSIQDRIYAKDQKTYAHLFVLELLPSSQSESMTLIFGYSKFRASHLAQIYRLRSIPGNQHPKSISNMRHEMSEKYTAAMKDMTSETRVMLSIYLIISGAISTVLLWAAHHYYHRPSSFYEATNYLVLVCKVVVVMIMYMSVLRQTRFWIEELERERREIMRGWDIVD
ncbi:f2350cb0-f1ad-44ad-b8da-0b4103eb1488 [Sclerotinia trifoliorum]|uniref:F2350cb0-f1ad-44ad-b8da-0b4103eb1488 n=1 Tax=Sclerotinia trifoliorum TaxID=28548 RepID=A0A8H2VQA8_9HELO|nr:f2350cb0-f1ad-44ad-b8da-0b4103eb1488 [Sclerotinia trifoliorum]